MREKFYNPNAEINYDAVLKTITNNVRQYIIDNNIKALIIGISGGIDSALNAAIVSPICKELGIPLIGRFLQIESNKKEESDRARLIGNAFCDDFKFKKLDESYYFFLTYLEEPSIFGGYEQESKTIEDKIRRGNVKARMRMMYLYNLSQKTNGIVVDNVNMTEYLLGFYTINGGYDISPLFSLLKTEVFELAKFYVEHLDSEDKKIALQSAIDAVPTDGLGITSSDVEQFGVNSYNEVDDILIHYLNGNGYEDAINTYLYPKYGKDIVDNIINRHKKTSFKRNHPYRIKI